jgi:hypothetical protein
VAHYQFRQMESGECELQYIPDREPPGAEQLTQVTSRLKDVLQLSGEITVESVKMLPPLTSGKFRLTSRS